MLVACKKRVRVVYLVKGKSRLIFYYRAQFIKTSFQTMPLRNSEVGHGLINCEKTMSMKIEDDTTFGMYFNTVHSQHSKDETATRAKPSKPPLPPKKIPQDMSRRSSMITCSTSRDISSEWNDTIFSPLSPPPRSRSDNSIEIARLASFVSPKALSRSSTTEDQYLSPKNHISDKPAVVISPLKKSPKDVGGNKKSRLERRASESPNLRRDGTEFSTSPLQKKSSTTTPHNSSNHGQTSPKHSNKDETNVTPIDDVKRVSFKNQDGEHDLIRVPCTPKRSPTAAATRKKQSTPTVEQMTSPKPSHMVEPWEGDISPSTGHSIKLSPSNRDNAATHKRRQIPATIEFEASLFPESAQSPDLTQEGFPVDTRKEERQEVRRIKLRPPLQNRKSMGRKRITKHSCDFEAQMINTTEESPDEGLIQ